MAGRRKFSGGLTPDAALRGAEETIRAMEIESDAHYAVGNLKFFLEQAWPTLMPGIPFQDNWHISCLVEHLEALARRDIRRLIINISPRSLKSTVLVAFRAWRWLDEEGIPSKGVPPGVVEKFLAASFGLNLARRDSRRTRALIKSQWYQARWGKKFSIVSDQDEKGRFDNDKGGFSMIASVEGGVLGEGGSCRLMDDPNDIEKMVKEPGTYPQNVREWYSASMASRSIDPRTDVALCVQQRSSYGADLTEYLEELGGWDKCVIPLEWRGAHTIGPLAYPDPRTHLGELMFPARFGPEDVATAKREHKNHYPAQFNQEPSAGGKSGLNREWFQFYNPPGAGVKDQDGRPRAIRISLSDGSFVERLPVELPSAFEQVVQSWDMAFKGGSENDYVAGHVWARTGANAYLMMRDHGHRTFPETLDAVRNVTEIYPCPEKLVEDTANGPAVIDTLKNEIPGIIPVPPAGGKWSRVAAISGYVEAGNVFLPNPDLFPWVWEFLAELAAGAAAKHDDDTDAMSQALKRLYDSSKRTAVPEFRVSPRLGEPSNAVHIDSQTVAPWMRRFVAVIPGRAALWVAELPRGCMRVVGELPLEGIDAIVAGRELGRKILADLNNGKKVVRMKEVTQKPYDVLLPKSAFAPIEPVGCWAELMEQSLLSFEPEEADWDARNQARETLRAGRIRTEMVEEGDAAVDRLRELLAFRPPDFQKLEYDRSRAFELAEENLAEYHRYMGMTEGKVIGDWPKLKISPECKCLIAELGAFRRDQDPPAFVEVLLLAVCAPLTMANAPDIRAMQWPQATAAGSRSRKSRKFSLGR
jgi:predicted phage terminase large subunit-like protein